jgi:hypothetical protein
MSNSLVHSFLLSSYWWVVYCGITFFLVPLLGTTTPTTTSNKQYDDVFLYIRTTSEKKFSKFEFLFLNFLTLPPTRQQQQTNNMMMSSCIFGQLLSKNF